MAQGVSVFQMFSVFAEFERNHSAGTGEGRACRGERPGAWQEAESDV